jgi:crotonobetainyl-CoA:carnitine CoA-transferase CaiB-like acyl-CoA transferase
MVISVPRPDGAGDVRISGNPIKLSDSAPRPPQRWPALGADTEAVLVRELGVSQAELVRLRQNGVVS